MLDAGNLAWPSKELIRKEIALSQPACIARLNKPYTIFVAEKSQVVDV